MIRQVFLFVSAYALLSHAATTQEQHPLLMSNPAPSEGAKLAYRNELGHQRLGDAHFADLQRAFRAFSLY